MIKKVERRKRYKAATAAEKHKNKLIFCSNWLLEQDLLELNGHVKSVTNSFERAS